jgi:hypothetical protein
MNRHSIAIILFLSNCVMAFNAVADEDLFKGGHIKYRFLLNTLPDDSLFRDHVDSPMIDNDGDLRLLFGWRKDKISLAADYQLIALQGDRISLSNSLPVSVTTTPPVATDKRRFFDLTESISKDNNTVAVQRLDRLYIEYAGTNAVARIGRQAISWGNGLIYTPMDFVNPFDPSTVDKEYKTGDDMLYGQYLQHSGNDLQAVWVLRRDINGNKTNNVNTIAAKYHGFAGNNEYDLLLARHYNDNVIGLGGLTDIGGAIWRADSTLTHTTNSQTNNTKDIFSLVTNLSYSWQSWGHNVSGILEYFYNGFGQKNGNYSPADLAGNSDLVKRILRGELFTLGRNYVATSAMIEMTPLWVLTPNVFINIDDSSFLTQLVSTYNLQQNWQLLAAISVPVGSKGTEYGGLESGTAGKYLSTDLNVLAQLAWYF